MVSTGPDVLLRETGVTRVVEAPSATPGGGGRGRGSAPRKNPFGGEGEAVGRRLEDAELSR